MKYSGLTFALATLALVITTGCDGSYYDEDAGQLVTLEAAAPIQQQSEELAYCGGNWGCGCAGEQSWTWKWWGWVPYYGYDCSCDEGFSGSACEVDERSWAERVEGWSAGELCEAAEMTETFVEDTDYAPADFEAETLNHQPSPEYTSQSACVDAGCLWVMCLTQECSAGDSCMKFEVDTMCNNTQGPWKDKCEWSHYTPGFLAFAGPGERCGFRYPECPDVAANNCFCDDSKEAFFENWCGDASYTNWCPSAHTYQDGRSQPCTYTGFTYAPQSEAGYPDGREICNDDNRHLWR